MREARKAAIVAMLAVAACSSRPPSDCLPLALVPRGAMLTWISIEKVKLPEPSGVSPELLEAWELGDRLLATPRADPGYIGEAELRDWAIDGWMPAQGARRELYQRARKALRAAPPEEVVMNAALTARMEESLAFDWSGMHIGECVADPSMCKSAARVGTDALRTWLERARERYSLCVELGTHSDASSWVALCKDRIGRIDSLRLMTRGRASGED